tara:strand:+ start:754 stop:1746 length:993 start_codon:yes stop_codon:yes gene_type:complete
MPVYLNPRATYGGEGIPAPDKLAFLFDPMNEKTWEVNHTNGLPLYGSQQHSRCAVTGISASMHQSTEADLYIDHDKQFGGDAFRAVRFNKSNDDRLRFAEDINEETGNETHLLHYHPSYPNAPAETAGEHFTIAVWVKLDLTDSGTGQGILAFQDNICSIFLHNDELNFYMPNQANIDGPDLWYRHYYMVLSESLTNRMENNWCLVIVAINNSTDTIGGLGPKSGFSNHGNGKLWMMDPNANTEGYNLLDSQDLREHSLGEPHYNYSGQGTNGFGFKFRPNNKRVVIGKHDNADWFLDGSVGQVFYWKNKILDFQDRLRLWETTRKRYGL